MTLNPKSIYANWYKDANYKIKEDRYYIKGKQEKIPFLQKRGTEKDNMVFNKE